MLNLQKLYNQSSVEFISFVLQSFLLNSFLLCYFGSNDVNVSPVIVSAIFVFPSHKYLSKVYCYFMWEKKFLAVHRVGLMTRRDRPFPVT